MLPNSALICVSASWIKHVIAIVNKNGENRQPCAIPFRYTLQVDSIPPIFTKNQRSEYITKIIRTKCVRIPNRLNATIHRSGSILSKSFAQSNTITKNRRKALIFYSITRRASTKTSTPMASFEASGKERRGAVAVDLTGVMATQLLL